MENRHDAATARVALLIDADNFSAQYATELFNKAAVYGNVIVRKAYGVMHAFSAWKPEILHRHAIEPVVRFHYVSGKNVSDIALVIDAMELMRLRTVDAVCIASNDSDFSLLAMKLRENGIKVYGFGDKESAKSFIASCDEYTRLSLPEEPLLPAGQSAAGFADESKSAEDNTAEQSPEPAANIKKDKPPATSHGNAKPSPTADVSKVRKMLADACDSLDSNAAGWIDLGEVTKYLKRMDAAFTPKRYGFGRMFTLVKSMSDHFEVKHPTQTTAHIRKKPAKSGKEAK